ncbi:MAG: 2,3-bisphosphoglycerate-independent phosphoglycerate mutase [Opitutae bacterium]|nr:2,3-bisphosphoglycerate-independent phosphoglycerate mutase [Opitutae bacterium]MBT5381176.1 2,3-bisphosphoglycerate-independent phosphoglycerate mutase [Opitutae bacterium]MBT7853585.1 2,3-bisphosphoglycerate-independent phosphoglycerate mutase [Opitutae bacterium]
MTDNNPKPKQPVLLVIRDGWGANHNTDQDCYNAIKLADTPVADRLTSEGPRTELTAHGPDVGLPEGIMGNSEVGHQNIGAGRIVDQEIVRITKGFETGEIKERPALNEIFRKVRDGAKLHLMGIVSDAGVHGMLDHLYGLLEVSKDAGLGEVYIHAFTDGRDTPPKSGIKYIKELEAKCTELGIGKIASVCGRFWSMDRDNRWERVVKAYDCLTGTAPERTSTSPVEAVQYYYDNPISENQCGDEFVPPTLIVDDAGHYLAPIKDGDCVLFYNYRGDRPREISRAFLHEDFDGFERKSWPQTFYVTMAEYQQGLCPNVLFPKPPKMMDILGDYLSNLDIAQFRCAETEKYPHVTFFFNDYREEPFPGEDRSVAQSPRVPTYDLQPEMSAPEVTSIAKAAILSRKYGFVCVNYANPDMVGHTGNLDATIQACEVVDSGVGELLTAIRQVGGSAIITADHGNADQLFDTSTGGAHTAHTLNPVELVISGENSHEIKLQQGGKLGDIAPTILHLMGLPKPESMTGNCLIL